MNVIFKKTVEQSIVHYYIQRVVVVLAWHVWYKNNISNVLMFEIVLSLGPIGLVVVVNHHFASLLGRKGLLSEIVIR